MRETYQHHFYHGFGTIQPHSYMEQTFRISGVGPGDWVDLVEARPLSSALLVTAAVSGPDQVRLAIHNPTAWTGQIPSEWVFLVSYSSLNS